MASTREKICTEALTWLKTPYRDHQRCKHAGVDCVNLLAGICEHIGLTDKVVLPYYSPQWHLNRSEEVLLQTLTDFGCIEKPLVDMQPADILVFHFGLACSHCAVLMPQNMIIHAVIDREVVMHRLLGVWHNALKHCYTFPGVTP